MVRFALLAAAVSGFAQTVPPPPPTPVHPVTETIHGVTITDPYRWLEDQNSPETRAWIKEQIAYTNSILTKLPGREAIERRLERFMRVETMSLPAVEGGRYFYLRRLPGENQAKLYYRQGLHGAPHLLVDPNPMSPDHTTSVALAGVSRDGKLIAYGLRRGGQDEISLTFLDVDTGRALPDSFPPNRYFSVNITPDRRRVYYSTFSGKTGPRIQLHEFGADPKTDREIFGSGYGKDYIVAARLSEDGKYLVYTASLGAGGRDEVYIQNVAEGGPILTVVKGVDSEFNATVAGGRLYIHTNWKAPNWHVYEADPAHPEQSHWREILPEGKNVMAGFSAVGGHLAATYLDNVATRMEVFSAEGKPVRTVELPGIGTASDLVGHWDSQETFFAFRSFLAPTSVYRYDLSTGARETWFEPSARLDPAVYETKQVWYRSKDGTRVPMFITARKGLKLDGSHPTLITAYGGFNISLTPEFQPLPAAFVDQGGVFAVPNLRGGGEFGEKWHQAGMLDRKQNVFDDFFAAAETLIRLGYTKPEHLAIEGRSNGGLLMGAAMTQRPDLYRAIVCGFPLLDMVRYDKFKVARWWVPEYGSADDANQFRTLYAYSPYHHVQKGGKYPAILFVSGDFDTRVDPLHARKMTALMQASTGSGLPVLLRYDTEAGHSSGLPVSREIALFADELSFIDWQLGVRP